MQKYILLYAVVVTALLVVVFRRYGDENRRLTQNQEALASEVLHYRTRWGQEAASAQALRLRCAEFEELRAADAARIRQLGIRLRRLEAAGKSVTETSFEAKAPLRTDRVRRAARVERRHAAALSSGPEIPLGGSLGSGRGPRHGGFRRLPRAERRHPAPGRAPHTAALPLHPLGHEGPAAGDRLREPPHADRLHGVHTHRAVSGPAAGRSRERSAKRCCGSGNL